MDPKLYRAVASGNESSFDELMMGSDPILLQKTTEGNTVLHVAAQYKQIKIAKKIMEFRSCAFLLLYHQNSDKDTPLHIAARVGCSEILQLLIDSAELAENRELEAQQKATRIVNDKEDTVLHVAVYNGHRHVVEILVPKDPGLLLFVNSVGDSPLFVAINKKFFKVAKFLLESSNECSLRGRDRRNALHAAVARLGSGHCNLPQDKFTEMLEVIKEIKNKFPSSILEEDDQGWTPFHYASKYGCADVVEMFLSDGDNSLAAYKKDKRGLSAFHVAAEIGYDHKVMEKLVRYCPDIWESLSNARQTALHVAVKGRNIKAIKYILSESSWDVLLNKQDKDGNTPLHLASLSEDKNTISLLLKNKKVDREGENKDGLTALDITVSTNTYVSEASAEKRFRGEEGFLPYSLRQLLSIRNTEILDHVDETKRKSEDAYHNKDFESNKTPNYTLHMPRGTLRTFKVPDGGVKYTEIYNPMRSNVLEKSYNQNAVVAALIAAVAFASAYQIPGGYESDGPYKGLAILRHKLFFYFFMFFDSIALSLSCSSVLVCLYFPDAKGYNNLKRRSVLATELALKSMVGAFISAVLLISANSFWFVILVAWICSVCFFGDQFRVFMGLSVIYMGSKE